MEEEATLLFRHLPAELTSEERKDLLLYLGATRVKVMGKSGSMKNTAFAVFPSKEQATQVLNQLHQVDFLGSRLIVEFAKAQLPHLDDSVVSQKSTSESDKNERKQKLDVPDNLEPREIKFDTTFGVWGLKYPRRPELKYSYPPPTPSILTNILNALAAVPKFYVQVLHLMNKMDLPAPFGALTPTPPLRPDRREHFLPDDINQQEMDISSEAESELESDGEHPKEFRGQEEHPEKHLLKRKHRTVAKKRRLADLQDSGFDPTLIPSIPVNQVFEQRADALLARRIELKLPSSIVPGSRPEVRSALNLEWQACGPSLPPALSNSVSSSGNLPDSCRDPGISSHLPDTNLVLGSMTPPLPTPPSSAANLQTHQPLSYQHKPQHQPEPQSSVNVLHSSHTSQTSEHEDSEAPSSGFGVLQPVPKEQKPDQEKSTEKEWSKAKFISSSELRSSRLSKSERNELSVFRNYSAGEPSCRLYIKNLPKNAVEEDIHWIYGRYVDWDNELETNLFDIKLMKEGRMKGQAFVTLPNEKSAQAAVKDTNGFVLKDKPIVVQFARSAKAKKDESAKNMS